MPVSTKVGPRAPWRRQQRAAAHAETRMVADLQGREGPGDHARAREGPGLARHEDAAPHPVAEMVARPAPDDQRRAVEAGLAA